MSQPIIEVHNLSKRYHLGRIGATTLREDLGRVAKRLLCTSEKAAPGEFWALRDVSFSIQPGEVVGVIGRNGAGKSTLLKILSRITEPTSGRAVLRGRVTSLLEVGTGFHPDLTGRENVYLNGAILGMKHAEIAARFDEIVAFAEVEKFIDTPVKHYSSGMRVRLAFAVAAHLDCEIMIVDEVLAVGDISYQKKCLARMKDISTAGGRTILYVSHQADTVRLLCQRAILMESGRVVLAAPVGDALTRYHGNEKARTASRNHQGTGFDRVSLVGSDGSPIPDMLADQPAWLELRLRIDVSETVEAGFTLLNEGDTPLLSGFSRDGAITLVPGSHVYRVRLPGSLLKAGRYRVEGAVWTPGRIHHSSESLCEFVVRPSAVELEGHSYRGALALREPWTPVP